MQELDCTLPGQSRCFWLKSGWLITIEAAFSIVEVERQIRVETLIVSIFEEGM
ncbi:MAG TPA: hypothetical protein VIH75_11585 [Candidatus Sulfotelmatobacter sp.]